jgi:hypothetical protein
MSRFITSGDGPLPSEEQLLAAEARLEAEIQARLQLYAALPPEPARAASSRAPVTILFPPQTSRGGYKPRAPKPKHFK